MKITRCYTSAQNSKTASEKLSTNLAAKVSELAADGHLSMFLVQCFTEELERRNSFEQKGA